AFTWTLFVVVLFTTHFSGLYEAALDSGHVHAFEHALYLTAAVLFWQPIVAPASFPAPPYPVRVFYAFMALPIGAFLGLAIYAARAPLFAHYVRALGAAGALSDQHAAGEIMWLAGGAALFVAMLCVVASWGRRDRRITSALERAG
ncbi:MAG: cytochrome c oxidase assembly protein, partial [Candidatus Eremiobacteraeota bacterium]|nr:cytochrome c oxidase assembly protein [Candidatus Eremiobacteraeota bacterium]